ncbi:hypothetical protein MRB53_039794 [Persea americana]|nr:hypothetical protein MRB53_039794 [Persea americana]
MIKVGLAHQSAEQIAENIAAVADRVIDQFVPDKWQGMRSIHIKTPESVALPVWLTEEVFDPETDKIAAEKENQKTIEEAPKDKKRKAKSTTAEATGNTDEAAAPVTKKSKVDAPKAKEGISGAKNGGNEKKQVEAAKSTKPAHAKSTSKMANEFPRFWSPRNDFNNFDFRSNNYTCMRLSIRLPTRILCRYQSTSTIKINAALPPLFVDQKPADGETVYVAMSGGVDSSVAAALLKNRYNLDVHGIFMRNWTDEDKSPGGCTAEKDWKDVQRVAQQLHIPAHRVDFSRDYWTRVFEPSLRQYDIGKTPNPDIACNREIKFGALIEHLREKHTQGKWWLATGHYTRAVVDIRTRRTHLRRGVDSNKDQTYFLSTLEQYALEHCYFPLSPYTKSEVRSLAREIGLHIAEKEESQGLCFVSPETKRFRDFLSSYLTPGPVTYVDEHGDELMQDNRGLWSSTIGERSGLQLNQGSPETQGKWYVSAKDSGTNTIELLRHRQEPVPCIVHHYGEGNVGVFFQDRQRSVAPGQHLAVYNSNLVCLGGGTILESIDGLDDMSSFDWQIGLNPLGL